jgi:hypothetical protein
MRTPTNFRFWPRRKFEADFASISLKFRALA